MFRSGLFTVFMLFLLSCNPNSGTPWRLSDLGGNNVDLSDTGTIRVLMFVTPDCPLSQLYAKAYSDLKNRFPEVEFYGVNSGKSDPVDSLLDFKSKYGFEPPILLDPDFKLAKVIKAEVTPHFFVIGKNGKVAYEGAMDDWAVDLGRKKVAPTRHYLIDALGSIVHDSMPETPSTDPVGCIIEYED